ncbi:TPA: acyl-CoA thioesterase [Streptococcus suis]
MTEPITSMTCRQTRSYLEHIIQPSDTNGMRNLFGGRLMYMVDSIAFLAFAKLTRVHGVTASMDQLNFIAPLPMSDSLHMETYVSGVSKKSVEVFVKVFGENLETGETYLAATAFLTFVAVFPKGQEKPLPQIIPETEEEICVCQGYEERRNNRLRQKEASLAFHNKLRLS